MLLTVRHTSKQEAYLSSRVHNNITYSKLLSISGGRLLHSKSEDVPCQGDERTI
jgi:hypothetical protein